jgi:hypothetical protein
MPLVEECISLANRTWTKPNEWNLCLDQEAALWQSIVQKGGLEMVCQTMRNKRYLKAPWTEMPPEGERLQKLASIPIPANDGLDHVVLDITMPIGWDGVATNVMLTSTDAGFIEGSSDLTWRMQVGARWIPDFGQVIFSLNNLRYPMSLVGGYIRLLSLQRIRIFVNVSPFSSVDPASRINAAILGWQYPKR